MQRLIVKASGTAALLGLLTAAPASAALLFSTGNPDGKIATATRPESAGKFEIESADDFVLTSQTSIHQRDLPRPDYWRLALKQYWPGSGRDLPGIPV